MINFLEGTLDLTNFDCKGDILPIFSCALFNCYLITSSLSRNRRCPYQPCT